MARSKNGEAISLARRSPEEKARLAILLEESRALGDLDTWRRARAIWGYVEGQRVVDLAQALDVGRSSINTWLRWFETLGTDGLRTGKPPGAAPRLSSEQRAELVQVIEAGPVAAGFSSGMWTGPMLRDWIWQRFGIGYHNHHVPRLLHQLGFSVQRPRKRLARADAEAQGVWLRERLPAIKKKRRPVAAS